jgi:hypothetical protein
MKIVGDYLVFSTGHREYANHGIVGIAPDLSLSTGYDNPGPSADELSPAERIELADYMIKQWSAFRAVS